MNYNHITVHLITIQDKLLDFAKPNNIVCLTVMLAKPLVYKSNIFTL